MRFRYANYLFGFIFTVSEHLARLALTREARGPFSLTDSCHAHCFPLSRSEFAEFPAQFACCHIGHAYAK